MSNPGPTPAATNAASDASTHRALRFLTAGSVDDGKSTLIGRLLMDCQAILADQLDTLERRAAGAPIDLSLLTDGLEAEREQGITIDVAYRYFATRRRKFIIADAPGHEQYTRNMVTAAAGSDAAVVLVDVTKLQFGAGPVQLLPQTRRHALLAHLLRVRSIVFAINKIDALAEPASAFAAVREALERFAAEAGLAVAAIVPVSALRGDNVATRLEAAWWQGPSLLQVLESLPAGAAEPAGALRIPVQLVVRHGGEGAAEAAQVGSAGGSANPERVFWGRIAQGTVRAGDRIRVLPGGGEALVQEVRRAGVPVPAAGFGESAGLVLDRPLDVSRGDWLVAADAAAPAGAAGTAPREADRFTATAAWLDTEPAAIGRRYWARHGNRWTQARITAIHHRLDIHTLATTAAQTLQANDIGSVSVQLQQALPLTGFAENPVAGALVLVDAATHRTAAALLADPLPAPAAEDDAWAA